MKNKKVILVDENDNSVGVMDKLQAHEKGLLHRAFSIFVFNSNDELIIHRRAAGKYHSPGLWTNTCCSHHSGEFSLGEEARLRLREEMGFDCDLEELFSFVYRSDVGDGLTENEYDHVFVGRFDGEPVPNPEEADLWKAMSLDNLIDDIKENPGHYTVWFKIIFERGLDHIRKYAAG